MNTKLLRKIGEPHPETIQIRLTEEQRTDCRKHACDLRDQIFSLVEEKKLKVAEFGQRKKALENLEAVSRQQASTGIEIAAVVVQDYLTPTNEVISVRVDTSDQVSRRQASADELQEELFGGSDDAGDESGFGKPS
jgi:hypothetical protein